MNNGQTALNNIKQIEITKKILWAIFIALPVLAAVLAVFFPPVCTEHLYILYIVTGIFMAVTLGLIIECWFILRENDEFLESAKLRAIEAKVKKRYLAKITGENHSETSCGSGRQIQ